VKADNIQRKVAVVDIDQLRAQLTKRQEEEAARRREIGLKKLLEEVGAVFRGKGPLRREATLKRWRYLATPEVPDVENARAYWEQSPWDPDAKAWRETIKTIEWGTGQVTRAPAQGARHSSGVKKAPADLQRLEQTNAKPAAFSRATNGGWRSSLSPGRGRGPPTSNGCSWTGRRSLRPRRFWGN